MFVLEARWNASCAPVIQSRGEELRKELWFTEELAALTSEGRPIWDGSGLVLRAGLEGEIKIYREGAQVRDSDELVLVYLVPLDGAEFK